MNVTLLSHAKTFDGVKETLGAQDHPLIVFWLSLCGMGFDVHDEVAWCSAHVNGVCWEFRSFGIPRSGSAAARSWLKVGTPVALADARPGYDIVIFMRGDGPQPGPSVLNAQGHVAFFESLSADGLTVNVWGGNWNNKVGPHSLPASRVLGVVRLTPTIA